MAVVAPVSSAKSQQKRAFWLKQLHQWHWISAASCLVGMALFSITGFTLNHATWFGATPQVTSAQARLPAATLAELRQAAESDSPSSLPPAAMNWLKSELSVRPGTNIEWSPDEIYMSLPRPGGDAWLTIDLGNGDVVHEVTGRGWLSYLNDLHKGRNAGAVWSVFIDAFAIAALVFSSTGLLLLKMHATHRPATWPMVGLGLVLPLIIALLFIH